MNKMHLKNIFVILLLAVAFTSGAQNYNATTPQNAPLFTLKTDKDQRYWGFTTSLINGISQPEFELGASRFFCPRAMYEIMDVSLSNVFFPGVSNFNPEVSAGISWGIFAARLCMVDYNVGFKTETFMLRPEIGFSMLGFIEVFYGQDISINNFENRSIRPFGWTIRINIPIAPKGTFGA